MTDNLPPLPWTYETNAIVGRHQGSGCVYLRDANGRRIATIYCYPDEQIAVAEFICAASECAKALDDQS